MNKARIRLERLEKSRPTEDGRITSVQRMLVRRDAQGQLWERPHTLHNLITGEITKVDGPEVPING